jgi:hypothetical protein
MMFVCCVLNGPYRLQKATAEKGPESLITHIMYSSLVTAKR